MLLTIGYNMMRWLRLMQLMAFGVYCFNMITMIKIRGAVGGFSTLNAKEMKQFDGISDWWHPNGPMHMLYKYNYHRVQFLKLHLPTHHHLRPLQSYKILDVGCGAGFLTKSLARLGATVVGIDPNITSYRQAIQHQNKNAQELTQLTYHNVTLEQYLQKNEGQQFDAVTSMDVIEHVDNPASFLKTIATAVRPTGMVMVSTIARKPATWLTHILLAEYVTGVVPKHTHTYDKFINSNELQEMMLAAEVQMVAKLELDINWKGELVEQEGGGNYILLGRKSSK